MILEPYTADLVAEMAKHQSLPLTAERLETVAVTLTGMRSVIAVLDTVMLDEQYLIWRDKDATI